MPITRQMTRRGLALALLGAVAIPGAARADLDPIYTSIWSDLAAGGHDVVAYFTEARPVEGSSAHMIEYRGARWRFANAENAARFSADPEAYAPQYGGYCAWAVSNNYTAATVPEAWTIADGKLYLNFSRRIQRRWERDMAARIAAADRNWPAVLG